MRIASVGHVLFAAIMIAIGITGFVKGDFGAIWNAVPKSMPVPAREVLIYLCAVVSLGCGIGLLWRRTAASAARVLLVYLLAWILAFKVRYIVLAPTTAFLYESWGETAVIVTAAWVLYAWFATDRDRRRLRFATGENGLRIARVIYGLAMLAFGVSHFAYAALTASLVPGWLPWHLFWAYFFGATYLVAGVGILIGVYARLAAALSAAQMALFTLLVWIPVVATDQVAAQHPFHWRALIVSLALAIGGWVMTDSYRGRPWFTLGRLRDRQADARQS